MLGFPLGILSAAGAGGVVAGTSFDFLESVLVTGSPSSVTFSSLGTYASSYRHLQIRVVGRTPRIPNDVLLVNFNGDSGTNYAQHSLSGDGSSVTSSAGPNQTGLGFNRLAGANNAGGEFGVFIMDILDAYSTTKNKTVRVLAGLASNAPQVHLHSALYINTAALTSVVFDQFGGTFDAGSRFSLYGIKG